ncbi:MAG TPA: GNAT family N-acetyltransferase [Acidimicrobiia bacterium]|nr:GNAT family N-acetyltransferase [Acidimicrobiia bacterium]
MSFRVRPSQPEDASVITSLLASLGYELTEDQIIEELNAHTSTVVFVAEDDSQVIGFIAANTRRQLHLAGRVTTIDSFVVDESRRSEGIGKLLLNEVISHAQERGSKLVDVHSNTARDDAKRFYEGNGFVHSSNYFKMIL